MSTTIDYELAVFGIAEVAAVELLAATLGLRTLTEIERNVRASVYWRQFVEAVARGATLEGKISPSLARVVMGWAKSDADALKEALAE
ncbi:MAG: hypothetical protein ABMA13_18210 [Chthoniobacteraceae bacterium]